MFQTSYRDRNQLQLLDILSFAPPILGSACWVYDATNKTIRKLKVHCLNWDLKSPTMSGNMALRSWNYFKLSRKNLKISRNDLKKYALIENSLKFVNMSQKFEWESQWHGHEVATVWTVVATKNQKSQGIRSFRLR